MRIAYERNAKEGTFVVFVVPNSLTVNEMNENLQYLTFMVLFV